ncbi:MAG: helix-turn-helix transcriptional regulator [Clostridia bacterium]|nr:helix-turn-helix transcriptional regulator [Clostridia bacterium]
MNLYIGENIKRLRKLKNITQETLAERMHVSIAAVSKWERGETLPDISMVIPLASYFGVSTDEILGLDHAKNEEAILKYISESERLASIGKSHERFNLLKKAYAEFPNDWRIVDLYMWQLQYDPNFVEGPFGNEVHKDELYALCERVLDECTVDKVRYSALSIIGGLYNLDGERDKAIETAKRFPQYWMTEGEELEGCYMDDNAEWLKQVRRNIWDLSMKLHVKLRNTAHHDNTIDSHKTIKYLKKDVSLIKMIFDDDDYGFYHHELSVLYMWIANRYVMVGDLDSAFEYYELSFYHAKEYDELPKLITHTSFFVKDVTLDMSKTNTDIEDNVVTHHISDLHSWGVWEAVKDTPQMKAIIDKYEPFTGKKKDYSV